MGQGETKGKGPPLQFRSTSLFFCFLCVLSCLPRDIFYVLRNTFCVNFLPPIVNRSSITRLRFTIPSIRDINKGNTRNNLCKCIVRIRLFSSIIRDALCLFREGRFMVATTKNGNTFKSSLFQVSIATSITFWVSMTRGNDIFHKVTKVRFFTYRISIMNPYICIVISQYFSYTTMSASHSVNRFRFPVIMRGVTIRVKREGNESVRLLRNSFPFHFQKDSKTTHFNGRNGLIISVISRSREYQVSAMGECVRNSNIFVTLRIGITMGLRAITSNNATRFAKKRISGGEVINISVRIRIRVKGGRIPIFVRDFRLTIFRISVRFRFLSIPLRINSFLIRDFHAFLYQFKFDNHFVSRISVRVLIGLRHYKDVIRPCLKGNNNPRFTPRSVFQTRFCFPIKSGRSKSTIIVHPRRIFGKGMTYSINKSFFGKGVSPRRILPIRNVTRGTNNHGDNSLNSRRGARSNNGRRRKGPPWDKSIPIRGISRRSLARDCGSLG